MSQLQTTQNETVKVGFRYGISQWEKSSKKQSVECIFDNMYCIFGAELTKRFCTFPRGIAWFNFQKNHDFIPLYTIVETDL